MLAAHQSGILYSGKVDPFRTWSVRSAVCTKRGPRKEPPMPIATTFWMFCPVAPFHSPLRTFADARHETCNDCTGFVIRPRSQCAALWRPSSPCCTPCNWERWLCRQATL